MPYLCMLFYLHQGVWPVWCITGSASTQENWQEISTWTLLHQDWWKFPHIFLPQFWSRGKSVCKNLREKGKKKSWNLIYSSQRKRMNDIIFSWFPSIWWTERKHRFCYWSDLMYVIVNVLFSLFFFQIKGESSLSFGGVLYYWRNLSHRCFHHPRCR